MDNKDGSPRGETDKLLKLGMKFTSAKRKLARAEKRLDRAERRVQAAKEKNEAAENKEADLWTPEEEGIKVARMELAEHRTDLAYKRLCVESAAKRFAERKLEAAKEKMQSRYGVTVLGEDGPPGAFMLSRPGRVMGFPG